MPDEVTFFQRLDAILRHLVSMGIITRSRANQLFDIAVRRREVGVPAESLEYLITEARTLAKQYQLRQGQAPTVPAEAPLPTVPEAWLGERWTPTARAYEEKRADIEYQRALAERGAQKERKWEPGTFTQEFAQKYGISPTEAHRLALGLAWGGGGALREGELQQLQALPLETRQELAWVGMEAQQQARALPALRRSFVPPLFEEMEVTGPPRWRDWFESKYGSMVRRFIEPEQRTKASWVDYLRKQKAKTREEWWSLGPFARGERPSVYQPSIKTVRF